MNDCTHLEHTCTAETDVSPSQTNACSESKRTIAHPEGQAARQGDLFRPGWKTLANHFIAADQSNSHTTPSPDQKTAHIADP